MMQSGKSLFHNNQPTTSDTSEVLKASHDDMQCMQRLCSQLELESPIFDDKVKEYWLTLLSDYIGSDGKRLTYSYISNWIFKKNTDRSSFSAWVGNVSTNIDSIFEYVRDSEDTDIITSDVRKVTFKFKDHIELAVRQCELFNEAATYLENKMSAEMEKKAASLTKDLTSQLVGLIGIFTALSFIVFGGITALDSLMESLVSFKENDTSIIPMLILGSVWSLCIMNLLYAFMYFVLKIVNISFNKSESEKLNIVQKHPFVFATNFLLLFIFLACCGIWLIKTSNVGATIQENLFDSGVVVFGFGIFLFFFIFFKVGKKLWQLYNRH